MLTVLYLAVTLGFEAWRQRRSDLATFFAAILVMLGFGVLYTSAFPPNHSFAILAGSVIFTAVVVDLFVLPAMLLFFRPTISQRSRVA